VLLSDQTKLVKVQDHTTAGTSAVNSDGVDMTGYDGVLFLTSFGTANDNNTVNGAQSDDDGSTDTYDDLEGSKVTSGTSPSNEDVWLDVFRPTKQYVRLEAARGTSSTLESIWAILYRGRSEPITNITSGTITGKALVSPTEGTA
jgi:hypothetical protein